MQFDITEIATNQFGCSDTTSTIVNVRPNVTATIIASDSMGCNPLPVSFSGSGSVNANSFAWNFGDRTKDTTTTSLKIEHKFAKVGQFIVTLIAKRKDGVTMGKDTKASEMITVY